MDDLAERYADRAVRSVFVYTREAHPGENYRHHTSMEGKRANARAFREQYAVRRPILLDDLGGSAHRAYGLLPNMTWIVMRGGLIVYKAAWTGAADVEDALAQALDGQARRRQDRLVSFYSERMSWRISDDAQFRAGLERTGPQAVTDFYGPKR
jgi:hypothetical protein